MFDLLVKNLEGIDVGPTTLSVYISLLNFFQHTRRTADIRMVDVKEKDRHRNYYIIRLSLSFCGAYRKVSPAPFNHYSENT